MTDMVREHKGQRCLCSFAKLSILLFLDKVSLTQNGHLRRMNIYACINRAAKLFISLPAIFGGGAVRLPNTTRSDVQRPGLIHAFQRPSHCSRSFRDSFVLFVSNFWWSSSQSQRYCFLFTDIACRRLSIFNIISLASDSMKLHRRNAFTGEHSLPSCHRNDHYCCTVNLLVFDLINVDDKSW